ncbi:hypothetical protein [Streptomyces sp. NPDC093060]|uniref:hypothetical protein n=1 Tax=Streptomyces sp. NPDC093060 TaxID=3366019 RepID=UPI003820BBE6
MATFTAEADVVQPRELAAYCKAFGEPTKTSVHCNAAVRPSSAAFAWGRRAERLVTGLPHVSDA